MRIIIFTLLMVTNLLFSQDTIMDPINPVIIKWKNDSERYIDYCGKLGGNGFVNFKIKVDNNMKIVESKILNFRINDKEGKLISKNGENCLLEPLTAELLNQKLIIRRNSKDSTLFPFYQNLMLRIRIRDCNN